MSEYENHKSPLRYRNQILTPPSYGPVPRKVGIVRDKPTVNYKQRVSFHSFSYLRSSIRRARYSFCIIVNDGNFQSQRSVSLLQIIYAPSSPFIILVQKHRSKYFVMSWDRHRSRHSHESHGDLFFPKIIISE